MREYPILGNAINYIRNNSENIRRKTAKKELKLRKSGAIKENMTNI